MTTVLTILNHGAHAVRVVQMIPGTNGAEDQNYTVADNLQPGSFATGLVIYGNAYLAVSEIPDAAELTDGQIPAGTQDPPATTI